MSLGTALDGAIGSSETAQRLVGGYLDGSQSFTEDLKDVLSRPAIDSADIRNLSVSAILVELLGKSDDGNRSKLAALIAKAKELGL